MGHLNLRTDLDRSFTSEKKKLSYPYIFIPQFGEEIALMVTCLSAGELPVVLSDAGTLKQVGSCAISAIELSKLLRVYRYEVVLSATEKRVVKSVNDIMEVLEWMVLSSS